LIWIAIGVVVLSVIGVITYIVLYNGGGGYGGGGSGGKWRVTPSTMKPTSRHGRRETRNS